MVSYGLLVELLAFQASYKIGFNIRKGSLVIWKGGKQISCPIEASLDIFSIL